MNFKNYIVLLGILSVFPFCSVYGRDVLVGVNITTPQQISLPIVVFKDSFNPNSFSLEPGLKGQKAHYIRWHSFGSGPAAWNYKVSTLYMTSDTSGLERGQLLVGGEIGGYCFDLSGSIGLYGSVSGKSKGSQFFVSASIGFVDIFRFFQTISKLSN